jgi:hypothetical protein
VLWRAAPNPDGPKPRKVPYQIADPDRPASSTNPATWGTFADAVDIVALLSPARRDDAIRGPLAGIAVILTAAANIACVDLDRVLDGDRLDPRAQHIVDAFGSFTERSPSNTGLHIFGRGQVVQAIRRDQIEIYGDRRMICVTGHRWPGTPASLHPVQAVLDRIGPTTPRPLKSWTGPAAPPPDDLGGALLARIRTWGLSYAGPLKAWQNGFLIELARCPWADSHSTGPGGAAIIVHASGAFDFTCRHAHCASRSWRDLRALMEMA